MPASSDSTPPEPPRTSDSETTPHRRPHLLGFIGNRFFAGLAVALPLIVTAWMLVLSYQFILFVGRPVIETVFHAVNLGLDRDEAAGNLITPPEWFLNLFGILMPLIVFFALGVMATNVLGAKIFSLVDNLLLRFPVISSIYSGLKQIMDSFRNFGAGRNFKRVAYVEYPAKGCRLLGFVTGQYHDAQIGKSVTSIFIPTSPNPMTGFVIVVEDEHVFESSLTVEQATKLILSAGLVAPDFSAKSPPKKTAAREEKAPGGSPETTGTEKTSTTTEIHAPVPTVGNIKPATPPVPERAGREQRFSFDGPGTDPVVRHDDPVGAPTAGSFDGLTGFEEGEE
ncbi:MAG: DUF502 domain-containing protein [Verrucomicrobiae bacterium]|nr:DUF502 domain-containing protein [Verrucomicrobiae bacterium]